jgi:hypothetical protein
MYNICYKKIFECQIYYIGFKEEVSRESGRSSYIVFYSGPVLISYSFFRSVMSFHNYLSTIRSQVSTSFHICRVHDAEGKDECRPIFHGSAQVFHGCCSLAYEYNETNVTHF